MTVPAHTTEDGFYQHPLPMVGIDTFPFHSIFLLDRKGDNEDQFIKAVNEPDPGQSRKNFNNAIFLARLSTSLKKKYSSCSS